MPPSNSSSTSSTTFLRQLSLTSANNHPSSATSSRRWLGFDSCSGGPHRMEALQGIDSGCGLVTRKRVMVVVDHSPHSKHAMIWALTHVANKGDLLTLLHVVSPPYDRPSSTTTVSMTHLANSLGSLCKACKPEVEVEALVVQGPRMTTVMSQVKKLEVSVLVLGQKRRSQLIHCLCGGSIGGGWEEFVEDCIEGAECLTIGVRKQSRGVGGYLISTRWHKNFWLLA
ncbi:hypothetical protein MLD38_022453 [Melastoma candidum]|uniref:Uncharacterized protein n=1 Tax=Melastoma candidum TaxID=119954 RepID=A0ACB9QMA7_9MYRT|nr:hypothetical protein MLD38_022453 [Melastoma candidum]